jgi:hypothetical protein
MRLLNLESVATMVPTLLPRSKNLKEIQETTKTTTPPPHPFLDVGMTMASNLEVARLRNLRGVQQLWTKRTKRTTETPRTPSGTLLGREQAQAQLWAATRDGTCRLMLKMGKMLYLLTWRETATACTR